MSDRSLPPLERVDIAIALSKARKKLWALGLAIDGLTHRLGADDDVDALRFILDSTLDDIAGLYEQISPDHRGKSNEAPPSHRTASPPRLPAQPDRGARRGSRNP
ncbi:MAG: hypothetical protein ACR652_05325 [Methylocystis sp.]|uniref:hypothetical protein n=1 Tax=Methylocystis sp. TaxID=1911079 RepID=UPI003DA4AB54